MERDAITRTRPNCAHGLDFGNKVFNEDCRLTMPRMPADSVNLVITSPPYFGCRVYGGEASST
jgi:hypothetical protein